MFILKNVTWDLSAAYFINKLAFIFVWQVEQILRAYIGWTDQKAEFRTKPPLLRTTEPALNILTDRTHKKREKERRNSKWGLVIETFSVYYISNHYIKWVTTSWTHSTCSFVMNCVFSYLMQLCKSLILNYSDPLLRILTESVSAKRITRAPR